MGLTFSSGNRLTLTTALATATPFSFAGWFYPTAFTASPSLLTVQNSTGSDYFCAYLNTSGFLLAEPSAAGTVHAAVTTVASTLNAWNHFAAVFASSTSRSVYLNGANKITSTVSCVPASLSLSVLGGFGSDSARADYFLGNLSFCSSWSIDLSDGDVLSLSLKFGPKKVRPDKLISYPLMRGTSPEADQVGSSWTVFGSPPVSANPGIYAP